jgi:hypothetical protein
MKDSYLKQAQSLELPSRDEMLRRAPSVERFWEHHADLLVNAWAEWDHTNDFSFSDLTDELLDERLKLAVEKAWAEPNLESEVQSLWEEVAPDVFKCQFFNPEKLHTLRKFLEAAWDARIPMRPPYGIVLNRAGTMLDPRSPGYLAAPSFQTFYRNLIDTYMRPIARMLFPEIMGYDTQSFGFSIQYRPNTDTSIRPHTDASSVTLNVNLNLQNEAFTGSSVDFLNPRTGDTASLMFTPGSALIHRGSVPHTALPITSGERTNFVLWLFGDKGTIASPYQTSKSASPKDRWVSVSPQQDNSAPF